MIRRRSDQLQPARSIVTWDLIGRTYPEYWQMWSLTRFIRKGCLATSEGDENRFLTLLLTMARDGKIGMQAIESALGVNDPELTRAWTQWAARSR